MVIDTDILLGQTERHLAKTGAYTGVLHEDVVEPFEQLRRRAATAGFDLRIASGYRSFDRQLMIWNAKASGQRPVLDDQDQVVALDKLTALGKIQAIMRFSALPGASRHHWGTDMDVYDANAIDADYQLQLTCSETEAGGPFHALHIWLDHALAESDFFRPYTSDAGGLAPEPWHLSYRPLAENYAAALNTEIILDSCRRVDMQFSDTIVHNIHQLFQQFIGLDCRSRV